MKEGTVGVTVSFLYKKDMKDKFLNDDELLAEAIKRMENADLSKTISHEEMMKKFGITQAELDEMDDVEIE